MKRKISFLLCLVLVVSAFALVLAACDNNPSGDEITLVVWGPEEDYQYLKEVTEAFKEANPDKKYDFLIGKQSEKDAATKLCTDPEGKADVFAFSSDQLNNLVQRGAIARIGGTTLDTIKANITEEGIAASSLTINGEERTYAIPFTDNTFYLYYDKSKFTADDVKTLDGILAKCDADHQFAYAMEDSWYMSAFYFGKGLGYEVTYNEKLAETSITCDFDCADGLAVTQAIYGYVQNPGMKANSDDSKIIAGMDNGSVIAAASGLWNAKKIKEKLGDNFACAPLPSYTLNGEQVQLRPFAGYKCIGVNDYCQNKAEAFKFALFLTNYDNQVKHFETRGYSPTDKEAMKLENIKNDECVKAIQQQLLCCKPQSGVPSTFWTSIQAMGVAMTASLEAGATPFDAQAQLTAAVKAIVKDTAA